MIIRCYSGRTVAEALTKVKNDLGDQALIIETRSVKGSGLLAGTIGYEVVAALEHGTPAATARPVPLPATLPPPRVAERAAERRAEPIVEPPAPAPVPMGESSGQLSRELAAIRSELHRLASGAHAGAPQLGEWGERLADGEMPSELLAELAQVVVAAGDRLHPQRRQAFLHAWLCRALPCQDGLDWQRTRTVLIAGPTGVGKTTTIAKLAAQLVHQRQRKVGILTIDTYRIGAQDQLRAYADLLDVPLAVASTPAQFARALAGFADCDQVLIDTAGRSPADAARVHELRTYCRSAGEGAGGLSVMLAIPATCGRAEFAAVVERFSVLPLTHTVVTKLDECAAPGRLYGCLRRHALEPAYFTTGQEVPADIVAGNARLLVNRLLDAQPIGSGA